MEPVWLDHQAGRDGWAYPLPKAQIAEIYGEQAFSQHPYEIKGTHGVDKENFK